MSFFSYTSDFFMEKPFLLNGMSLKKMSATVYIFLIIMFTNFRRKVRNGFGTNKYHYTGKTSFLVK